LPSCAQPMNTTPITRTEIATALAHYRRFALRTIIILLVSIFACVVLILGWRYFTIGAFEYPRKGTEKVTDYFAMAVFVIWGLAVFPWLYVRESRWFQQHGLFCPHCGRTWQAPLLGRILGTGTCPYCHASLATTIED
jgi:hypothetical protein